MLPAILLQFTALLRLLICLGILPLAQKQRDPCQHLQRNSRAHIWKPGSSIGSAAAVACSMEASSRCSLPFQHQTRLIKLRLLNFLKCHPLRRLPRKSRPFVRGKRTIAALSRRNLLLSALCLLRPQLAAEVKPAYSGLGGWTQPGQLPIVYHNCYNIGSPWPPHPCL